MILEAVSRSPIFHAFSESANGAAIIRAFDMQDEFLKERFMATIDNNTRVFYWNFVVNRVS